MDDLKRILSPYQKKIERELRLFIGNLGKDTSLRQACEYALLTEGKRFRPALVLMVSNALMSQHDVIEAALAIEFFHTASLIADDLPCMDDDDSRRERPTLHKVYGEAKALLASYALIAAGYECLAKNTRLLQRSSHPNADSIGILALENATFNTGIHGATGGQFLDLFPPEMTKEILDETIQKKTVSLFEISMVLGWLFGGGNLAKLPLVKQAAYHYGMAFQMADDISDYSQDSEEKRAINTVSLLGLNKTQELFYKDTEEYFRLLKELGIHSEEMAALGHFLTAQVKCN